jgi:hypothetical protein
MGDMEKGREEAGLGDLGIEQWEDPQLEDSVGLYQMESSFATY